MSLLKPIESKKPQTEPVTFRMRTVELKAFDRACETVGIKRSEGLRQLIAQFIATNGETK